MNLIQLRRGEGAISAVGEQHHMQTLRAAWNRTLDPDNIVIALVPEPHNVHDPYAVRMDILINGEAFKAGYIAADEVRHYQPHLMALWNRGLIGYGYGKIRESYDRYEVYVRLSTDPSRLVPPQINDPIGVFVDGRYPLAVIGEENFQHVLAPYAQRGQGYVFALHPTAVTKGKYKGERTYSVYLDGQVVGELTRAMALKHGQQFDNIFASGHRPYLLGNIEEDHRGIQVVLEAPPQTTTV